MKPPRSLMGLFLACLLAAPAAASDVPNWVWAQRIDLISQQMAERMNVTAEAVKQELTALRKKDQATFEETYQGYVGKVDARDKAAGNSKAADQRDAQLAQQVVKVAGGDVKTLTQELIAARTSGAFFAGYEGLVSGHESTLLKKQQEKNIKAKNKKLAEEYVAAQGLQGKQDAKTIEAELNALNPGDGSANPYAALVNLKAYNAKVEEYKGFTATQKKLANAPGGDGIDSDVREWTKKLQAAYPTKTWIDEKLVQEFKNKKPQYFKEGVDMGVAVMGGYLTGYKKHSARSESTTGTGSGDPVQEWVQKVAAVTPGLDQAEATKKLQELKTTNPQGFENLITYGPKQVGAWLTVTGMGTGYPRYMMTKVPAGGGKPKGEIPQSVDGKPVEDQVDPLDASDPNRPVLKVLEAMLKKDPKTVGSAMALRIGDYLVHGDEDKYLSAELRSDEGVVKGLAASAQAWVDQMVKGGKSGRVAVLYFALGTGGQDMSWTGGDKALAALPAEGPLLADLVREMKPWTGEAATGKTPKGPLTNGKPETAFAFYEDAATNAKLILDKKGASVKDMTLSSIAQNEQKDGVPGGSGLDGKITGPIKGFDFKDLYLEGSVGNENVHQIKDPYGHGRHIILKMMTVSEGGKVYNKIGIYDVTNTGDVFGRKFDVGLNGSANFVLDDRTPGMPEYKLSFKTVGDKTEVVFGRAGKSEPEHEIHTSVAELYDKRAQQAARDGSKISIDGQDFIVLGQGGAKGGLLFFPGDLQKRLDKGESQITPSHLATGLSERLPDGRNLPASGKPQLRGGKINGEEYHLEWDDAAKAWKVAKGAGDPDPVATPPGGTTGGGTTGTSSGGGQSQTTSSTGGGDAGGADEAKQKAVIQQLLDGGYEVNAEVANGLSPDVAQNFMVISLKMDSKTPKPFAERHYMTAPGYKVVGIPAAAGGYKEDLNKRQPGEVIGIERYMALTAPNGDVSYYDVTDADIKRPAIYKPAGSYTADGKRLSGVTDALLCDPDKGAHALTAAGFSKGDAAKAHANLREAMVKRGGPTSYLISGSKDTRLGLLVSGQKTIYFWPKVEEETSTSGAGDERSGQGTAYDNSIGGGDVDEPFPKAEIEPTTPAGAKGYLVKDQNGAALYADDKDSKKAQRWWLVFTYVNNDGAKMQSRQIMVFDKTGTEDLATFPGLDKLSVSGTTKTPAADVPHFGAVWLITGSDANQGKGVYGAFSNKDAKQVRDKPGKCLGPVIWWGVSAEEALAACEANQL